MGNKCPVCGHRTSRTYDKDTYLYCEAPGGCDGKWVVGATTETRGPHGSVWMADKYGVGTPGPAPTSDSYTYSSPSSAGLVEAKYNPTHLQELRKKAKPLSEIADSTEETAPVSVKHDHEKPAVQYIPMEALFAMGEAYGFGARKYGGYNFQITGLEVTRCLGAATRHIFQFLAGENNDKESGKSHLGHAMAAIGMAIYSLHHHKNKDDRFVSSKDLK